MHYALCPYCLSTLKISEEQLALRAGLVRCSHCNDIFNAYKNKLPEPDRQRLIESIEKQHKETAVETQSSPTDETHITLEVQTAAWEPSPKKKPLSLPLGFISFLLVIVLIGQVIYIQSDAIVQTPRFQPFFKQLNKGFDLNIPAYKNVDEIQVIDRQLRAHASLKGALSLQLTMKNTALAEQNFPNIDLVLTSNSGEIIAHRTFTKYDYLKKSETSDFFEPQSLKEVSLTFKDAQKSTSGFEISFSF